MSGVRTTCPYCGVGCGLVVDGDTDRLEVTGDPQHPANLGRLCSKGSALPDTLTLEGRLLEPHVNGMPSNWDTALDTVARGLCAAVDTHGPDAVAFYVSGQLLTEDYYVANKLMKGFIGSANIDTNSRLCMASAVAGQKRAFGADFVPTRYTDLEHAELIVIVGANMAWCHPVLYQRMAQAKADNPGLRVVVIDPRRTATCDAADLFLPIAPGTDVTLFNGLLNYLRREDALDWTFLETHTENFYEAMSVAKGTAPSIPHVAAMCGVPDAKIAEFYRLFSGSDRVVTLFSQGVNQSSSGTDKVNSIINVHLATGRIGKPGSGPFSLTGQPNAMGGREVGGLANQLAAHMDFDAESVDRVARFWRAHRMARKPGLKAVDLFHAIEEGRVRAVWIMSTNPVVSMPDAARVEQALERCDLVVVSDSMQRTDTTRYAHVLLPAATWGEKSGTVTNSERRISRQRSFMPAPGQCRPDWWIVTEVAHRMGFAAAFAYASPADIFREHARLSAFENEGRRDFDIGALATLSDADYEALEPVRWPRSSSTAEPAASVQPVFFTPSGKARFVATRPRPAGAQPDRDFPFVLNTGRIRDQWHTMTRTGQSAKLSGHTPEPFVQLHPDDAAQLGIREGALAEIMGRSGARLIGRARVTDAVQPGHMFAPMHWNAQFASHGRVGALIEAWVDPVSGQPELKHAAVALRAYEPTWHGFVLSRTELDLDLDGYRVRVRGSGYWRYELAGRTQAEDWGDWARRHLGAAGHWLEFADRAAGRYRGATLDDDRLRACIFIAEAVTLPGREWLGSLFGRELDGATRLALLAGRPRAGVADGGPIVCTCFAVGRNTLVEAIRSQGLVSAEQIGHALQAGTNCGSCIPELKGLIEIA